ncbi:RCC1 domain-containing protein [Streptosporangium sp. NPDC000396]|uniref:RCC1 domain-containing protein n=1 Tax=Streptosporangium sp. NPDC000396 TaxID=3366185 RepID=UPI0036A2FABB
MRGAATAALGLTLATLMVATGASPASAASTRVKTWGLNGSGQLGDATTTQRNTPVTAAGLTTAGVVSVVGGGSHSLALLGNGTIEAWGRNVEGQLGDGAALPDGNNLTPGTVAGLSDITAVAAGNNHSLALRNDGTVWSWGSDNEGQLGNGGANADSSTPGQVLGTGGVGVLTNVVAIAADGNHSLALLADGTVRAWGSDDEGQLGDGAALADSPFPVQVLGTGGVGVLSNVRRIAAGGVHSLALLADGTVRTWGRDDEGQLGNGGPNADSPFPVQVVGTGGPGVLSGVQRIAGGGNHSLALLNNGTVRSWGSDSDGQLGDGGANANSPFPVTVLGTGGVGVLSGVFAIAAGGSHSLALASNQPVQAWGNNLNGQLGNGNAPNDSPFPVGIRTGVSGLTSVSAGGSHSLVV